MSRAAEEAAERWFEQHGKDCDEHFKVGVKVYRVYGHAIEEGVVRKVGRCDDPDYGDKPNGKYAYYAAEFRCQWVAQTFAWRFFWCAEHANAELGEEIDKEIAEKQRQIEKLKAQRATLPPPLNWPI